MDAANLVKAVQSFHVGQVSRRIVKRVFDCVFF